MIKRAKTPAPVVAAALIFGTVLLAGCGSPNPVVRTTVEETTTTVPRPVVSTTTTTTREIEQR